ncbi:hypothetical protein V6N11_074689 [Hibiscus sabdariffa]|uniref:RNase H type-1 domain-containing protein n=1 Tax=Hibiscus sabdariffa TaxID=183260 RepID=A0ABR2R495_9ROSI
MVAVSWEHPRAGYFTLNTNVAVSSHSENGFVGGAFHGPDGEWVVGYHKFVGFVSPLSVELWSILISLDVAWSQGIKRIQVQSDCPHAFHLLQNFSLSCHSNPLIRTISSVRSHN